MSEYKRWPIGLQTGPTGQPDGIGEVIRALTDNKIAMFSASSDSMSIIFDLQEERKETGVPHTGNYIPTGYVDGYHISVPHHGHPPTEKGAVWHWDHIEKRGLPGEIDWEMPCIWLSTWNEVRPYLGWARMDSGKPDEDPVEGFEGNADWMGHHAVEVGKEAVKRGYRWAAFGFAGGDPEPGFWEAPGVLEYLQLCEKHPDHLGIALHEYSHIMTILNEPDKIGRFKQLHDACDKHGIRRPVIQIKEFGWGAFDAPEPKVAIEELVEVAEMYMEHPNIHGAAIWTVQEFHGDSIRKAVKPIIPHLKDAALQNAQPIPELKLPGDGIPVGDSGAGDSEVDSFQVGMNIDPHVDPGNPQESGVLGGMDWVRFEFKVDGSEDSGERGSLRDAIAHYDGIVKGYADQGVGSLIVLNQEMKHVFPEDLEGGWPAYCSEFAAWAGKIAGHYKEYGNKVAYEIWNKGDQEDNPEIVYLSPENFAALLEQVVQAIRTASPESKVILGGLVAGPDNSVPYVKQTEAAFGGALPVDAIGVQPYGRYVERPPFAGWGFGTLAEALDAYTAGLPGYKFWITEIGVANPTPLAAEHYPAVGDYLAGIFKETADRYADSIPVVIWYAWSDHMNNAGIVDHDGQQKGQVFEAFRQVSDREFLI